MSVQDDVAALEKDLGLPSGFYERLLKEDDWSFVIKLHALLESAATHLLATELRHDELKPVLARLELGDKDRGKIAFAKALGLFSKEERALIAALGELRNDLVHSVGATTFTFAHHIAAMDKNQRQRFVEVFGDGIALEIELEGKIVDRAAFILQNAKLAIWSTAMLCVGGIYLNASSATLEREHDSFLINSMRTHLDTLAASLAKPTSLAGLLTGLVVSVKAGELRAESGGDSV